MTNVVGEIFTWVEGDLWVVVGEGSSEGVRATVRNATQPLIRSAMLTQYIVTEELRA